MCDKWKTKKKIPIKNEASECEQVLFYPLLWEVSFDRENT